MTILWDYLKDLCSNWRSVILLLFSFIGMAERFSDRKFPLPRWAKNIVIIVGLVIAPFFAYRQVRLESLSHLTAPTPSISMLDDTAKRADGGRTDFRFTLRNFGGKAAVFRLSYILLLNGHQQDLQIHLPERSILEPRQTVDLNLPLTTTPELNSAIWTGQAQVEVTITADYSWSEASVSKKYNYTGQFDYSTGKFSTVRSE